MTRKIIGSLLIGSILLTVPAVAFAADHGNTHMDLTFKTTARSQKAGTAQKPRPVSLSLGDHAEDPLRHRPAGDLEGAEHHAPQGVPLPGPELAEEAPL